MAANPPPEEAEVRLASPRPRSCAATSQVHFFLLELRGGRGAAASPCSTLLPTQAAMHPQPPSLQSPYKFTA